MLYIHGMTKTIIRIVHKFKTHIGPLQYHIELLNLINNAYEGLKVGIARYES